MINKQGILPPKNVVSWKALPENHHYELAHSYLKLLTSPERALEIVDRLIDHYEVLYCRSGDILRAAGLFPPVLPNQEFNRVIRDISSKNSLCPPLLVRSVKIQKLHIAHGYEVVAALHFHDMGQKIPVLIVDWDSPDERA